MAETFKFPNGGYDVRIVRKQDVVACIEKNITDGDLMLDLIKQLELDAANFLREGRWAGIPYLGNIRIPRHREIMQSKEVQELIQSAKETLDKDKYILFRRRLDVDSQKRAKQERYYNYMLSRAVNKNIKYFKKVSKTKGDVYAKILIHSIYLMTPAEYSRKLFNEQ